MYSKIKIAGHPIHPMLVAFPVAFYTAALAGFIYFAYYNPDVFWFKVAYLANAAGVIMAIVAALPGFIDWLGIPSGLPPKRTGLLHMVCNVLALGAYGFNWYQICNLWNATAPAPGNTVILTAIGFVLTIIAGFLGWTMVQKHHVGVEPLPAKEMVERKK
jgi:uncharacterized membrane protein